MTPHTQIAGRNAMHAPLRHGDIRLDARRYRAWRGDQEITLTTREFQLLALLLSEPGRVFTRDEVLDHVWGDDAEISDRNVDACVKRLRHALARHGTTDPIRTVRLVGYAFDEFYGTSRED